MDDLPGPKSEPDDQQWHQGADDGDGYDTALFPGMDRNSHSRENMTFVILEREVIYRKPKYNG
ncbi:hypothetical protein PG993_005999 [Apiospora rasikravindrae]|uniref:Uncharacterized protein n=1 Tax=Apiospora rasikravindrae TaxID=990691 RepID=A0ABR1TAD5_9PEZI